MPFIPVPNVCQAELIFNWNGQVVENVLHYSKSSPWTIDTLGDLAAELKAWWDTGMQPIVAATLSLTQIKMTDLASATGPVLNYNTGLPLAGLSGSPSMPNSIAVVITKRTDLRGRSYRGRIYHCGLTEEQCLNSALASGVASGLLAVYAATDVFSVTGDEAIQCVVSRYSNGVPRVTGIATPVTNFTTDGIIDSQRRRLPGRGS